MSRATVSQILNGHENRFVEETVARVRAAAEELNYRPSSAGRNLVRGHGDTIVLLVPDTTFGRNLQDIADRLTDDVQRLFLNVVVRFFRAEDDQIDRIQDLRPFAVIDLAMLDRDDRRRLTAGGAIVVPDEEQAVSAIDMNQRMGALQMDALLATGDRSMLFAFLEDDRSDPYGPHRFDGAARRLAEFGLPEPASVRIPLDRTGAVDVLRPFFDGGDNVGVACYNDDVAIAVLAAARELGRDVPSGVAVVGNDFTPIGQLVQPTLTTIAYDTAEYIDQIVEMLRCRLQGGGVLTAHPRMELRLVAGGSTAAL